MKTQTRLEAALFTMRSAIKLPDGKVVGEHVFEMQVGFQGGRAVEIAFAGRGKVGQGTELLFQDVGLWVSRVMQGRDPVTGDELGLDPWQDRPETKSFALTSPQYDVHGDRIGDHVFEMVVDFECGRAVILSFDPGQGIGQGLASLFDDVQNWVNRVMGRRDPISGEILDKEWPTIPFAAE